MPIGEQTVRWLWVGFGDRYRINGSLLLNHRTSKWNFGLAYDNWFTTRTRQQDGDRKNYNLPNEYFLTQRRSDERIVQTQTARFNIDYTPNKKNKSFRLEGIGYLTVKTIGKPSSGYYWNRNLWFYREKWPLCQWNKTVSHGRTITELCTKIQ